jgi:hypothetical protein
MVEDAVFYHKSQRRQRDRRTDTETDPNEDSATVSSGPDSSLSCLVES